MARSNLFYFRHFVIDQANCAMKVGADSMLLGSLVPTESALRVLDIGTGSGVLALMMAQRTKGMIDGVEIEENAYIQAVKNASDSSWRGRIKIYHTSLQNFNPPDIRYDLIISNPPYFVAHNSLKSTSPQKSRANARDHNQLSFEDLLFHAKRLLAQQGKFYVILPFAAKQEFINKAEIQQLYISEEIDIRSKPQAPFIRVILGFTHQQNSQPITSEFTIYKEEKIYTEAYLKATENFHAHNMRLRNK